MITIVIIISRVVYLIFFIVPNVAHLLLLNILCNI